MRSRAGGRGGARSACGTGFDLAHNGLGLFDEAMGDQPARAFRNPTSHDENDKSYRGADQEGQPPSQRRVDKGGIEQDDRAACAHGRSDPEAAVDQEVSPAAQAARIGSWIVELMAVYSPPMPVPVGKRNSTKLQAFHDKPVAAVAKR